MRSLLERRIGIDWRWRVREVVADFGIPIARNLGGLANPEFLDSSSRRAPRSFQPAVFAIAKNLFCCAAVIVRAALGRRIVGASSWLGFFGRHVAESAEITNRAIRCARHRMRSDVVFGRLRWQRRPFVGHVASGSFDREHRAIADRCAAVRRRHRWVCRAEDDFEAPVVVATGGSDASKSDVGVVRRGPRRPLRPAR